MYNTLFCLCEYILLFVIIYCVFLGIYYNNKVFFNKYKYNPTFLIIKLAFVCLISIILHIYSMYNYSALFGYIFNGTVISDPLCYFAKVCCVLLTMAFLLYFRVFGKYYSLWRFEYIIFVLACLLGVFGVISSNDFITAYISLELQVLCTIILTAARKHILRSVEDAVKYFILATISSAFLLMGISIIYYITGSTNFIDIALFFKDFDVSTKGIFFYMYCLVGVILIFSGILFKIGLVPFHKWLVDIYEGVPTVMTLFFATVPPVGIIVLLIRLNVIFFAAFSDYLYIYFSVLSLLSVTIGILGAINQTKIKRIISYSSISNMGFLLSFMGIFNLENASCLLYYMFIYLFLTGGLWSTLLFFKNDIGPKKTRAPLNNISDLPLIYGSNRYLAIFFLIFLFSSMGIPPLMGFFSKLYLFKALLHGKMYFMLIYFIFMNALGCFYFLNLIIKLFSFKPVKSVMIFMSERTRTPFGILVQLILWNFIFSFKPDLLYMLCYNVLVPLFLY